MRGGRQNHLLFTIDYETWHPIPEGYSIDWEKDMLENANRLMEAFESVGAKITFMVEVCELLWLKENNVACIENIEAQLTDMVRRGHDVQLHMHPNWMPETGAKHENGEWYWDWGIASAADYPGDYSALMKKCKEYLEKLLKTEDPSYSVKAYRAGAYRVQPFKKTYTALLDNHIQIDTSVFPKGVSNDRGYDFRGCPEDNQPFFASKDDPQVRDLSLEEKSIIELPITTQSENRLFIDNDEAAFFAKRFLALPPRYFRKKDNFFVFIGHSKGEHDYDAIIRQLSILKSFPGNVFSSLSDCSELIKQAAENKSVDSIQNLEEIEQLTDYVHRLIEPVSCEDSIGIDTMLYYQKGLCLSYAEVLCHILKQYGYDAYRITATAANMPNGRGRHKVDTHEIVGVRLQNDEYVIDPTCNTIFKSGIKRLLSDYQSVEADRKPDNRYEEKQYSMYDTQFFYDRVIYYVKNSTWTYCVGNEVINKYYFINKFEFLLFKIRSYFKRVNFKGIRYCCKNEALKSYE